LPPNAGFIGWALLPHVPNVCSKEHRSLRYGFPIRIVLEAPTGSFEAAQLYQLRMALKSTYAQRLQDLQDMLDFNAEAEAHNPRLRWVAARLRRP
jgi:hypothetical protein